MKTRILITYLTYGNGHKSVANYIKNYLEKENKDLEIKCIDLLDIKGTKGVKRSQKVFDFLLLKVPFLWHTIYTIGNTRIITASIATVSKGYNSKNLYKEVKEFNPDIVISTHFLSSALMEQYIKKKSTMHCVIIVFC